VRRLLVRRTICASLVAAAAVGLPVLVLLWFGTITRPELMQAWMSQSSGARVGQLLAAVLVPSALCVTVIVLSARRSARVLADPLVALAEAAESLGEGQSRVEPMRTGIPEVDRVSDVLARSAQQMTTSDASHQLRTPLTALLMRLEEIAVTQDLDVVQDEAAVAIAQVERLTRVVDELLMRSRRSNDAPRPQVSLDSVIAALQREWQPAFERARRSVRVHGERGLVVRATPVALSQVLSTLLENSLVHGRGTVDVQARRSGPSVVVEVRDQGDGVPATIAPHIFERSVSSGTGNSTGLGLALARDLAESNGGRLDLIQAQPATFALFLSEGEGR